MATMKVPAYEIATAVSQERVYLDAIGLRAWLLDLALENEHEPMIRDTAKQIANALRKAESDALAQHKRSK